MAKIWDDVLTDLDKLVIEKGGYGKSRGLGKKPLLMIIDVQYNYVGDDVPLEQSLEKWPSGGGNIAWAAVRNIIKVKKAAEEAGIPIFQSRNVQKKTLAFDGFSTKTNRDQTKYLDGRPETQIVEELAPGPNEMVIDKAYASVFYGTPFQSYLVKLGIDTIVIVGGSTSGCCRATAVDAVTRSYNVAMVEDCLYDRISISHKAALLDCWMKYCDVMNSQEIIDYFNSLKK